MANRLLTTGQAAQLCSVTSDTVLKWIRSGRLPAQRTPGGHHRIDRRDLEELLSHASPARGARTRPRATASSGGVPFLYCWQFYADEGGEMQPHCADCVVFQTRARRCYELARLAPGIGCTRTYCTHSCEDCDYYQHVCAQDTNVLIVSNDPRLAAQIARDAGQAPFNIAIADCEYTTSAKVDSFRPDFAIVDCALGPERSVDIVNHLASDPRIPFVRLIVAASPGEFPADCDQSVFAMLYKPFSIREIVACIGGIPSSGSEHNHWMSDGRQQSGHTE